LVWMIIIILLVHLIWDWDGPSRYKAHVKTSLSVVVATLIIGGIWIPVRKVYRAAHPVVPTTASLSITASRGISYKDGEDFHGIKWEADFRAVRMELKNNSSYPLHNLDVTVKVIDKSGDLLFGMGQISDIPGCQFHGLKWPDINVGIVGTDGHTYPFSPQDYIGDLPMGGEWSMFCSSLPRGLPITLLIATNPGREIPKRLKVIGSYQEESGTVFKFDKLVGVAD
jgi:hypothetical protein